MQRQKVTQAGVTLIEMLVVVTIIALFAALVAPKMIGLVDKVGRTDAAKVQIKNFSTALNMYKLNTALYPSTEQGLQALHVKPENVNNWEGPYLQEIPLDPWGHAYVYKFPGEHGDEPDIICLGADGQPGGDGVNADIVSWKSQ